VANEFAPGANIGNPSGFIKGLIDEGEGPTSGLQIFRDAGGEIRTQTWFQLYGEVNEALITSGEASALDPYQLPDPAGYSEWKMGRGGQFATQVKVFFTDRDTGVVGTTNYTYITDQAHTPGEAEAAAFDEYADADNENEYGQTVQGTMTTNVFATVPWST